jgi:hypothetical protein
VAHYQLFDALLALAGSRLSSDSVTQQVSGEKRDDTRQALDAVGRGTGEVYRRQRHIVRQLADAAISTTL